jgi:hypothetical protein
VIRAVVLVIAVPGDVLPVGASSGSTVAMVSCVKGMRVRLHREMKAICMMRICAKPLVTTYTNLNVTHQQKQFCSLSVYDIELSIRLTMLPEQIPGR